MAIKERKQITGTAAQIKKYAGHNGVLAYATDTKHLHVLSGVAGQTTELANRSDIPAPQDISGKADKTYVDQQLATKASNSDLTSSLAGKAEKVHKHTKAEIADFPSIPDASTLIPKSGARGVLSGYEALGSYNEKVNQGSPDVMHSGNNGIQVSNGTSNTTWTKVVYSTGGGCVLDSAWSWAGGSAPTIKTKGVFVLHWNNDQGIVNYIAGAS